MSTNWWRGAVIYQIYPRSFCDTDADGIGDLPGIIRHLDHVASLGVDGVWLSPFFPSPMKDFGYDISDYRGVDPMFGSLDDCDRLIAAAHARGLRVIIDQVYSHSSDRHPWFRESSSSRDNAKADWYVWADPKADGTPPNNWLAIFGGPAWEWNSRRKQYYLHNFLREQPDLNFHSSDVQEAILETARFWLDRGVDGFRLDVANLFCHDPALRDNPPRPHPNPVKPYVLQSSLYNRNQPETLAFVARLRALVDSYPGAMTVAEIASDDPVGTMVEYTDGPERYHTAYSFVFLRQAFGARHIRDAVEESLARSTRAWPSWAFSNHDVERVVSRWGSQVADRAAFAKLMIAVLTCLRGTAFLYQGEELGLTQADIPFDRLQDPEGIRFWPEHKGRDGCRTPMPWSADDTQAGFTSGEPWLPIPTEHHSMAVDRQNEDPQSVFNFARRFLAWRKLRSALIEGDIHFLDVADPILAFKREAGDDRLLCVFNLSETAQSVALSELAKASSVSGHGLPGEIQGDAAALPAFGGLFAAYP